MSKTLNAMIISAGLLSAFVILPTIAPANAENAVPTAPEEINTASGNNCLYGEKIDGSTAEQALRKFQEAGYSDVKILKKGCDNYWHGTGAMGGESGNIVLSPDGTVMQEGD